MRTRALAGLILVAAPLAGCIGGGVDSENIEPAAAATGGFSTTTVYPGQYDTGEDWALTLTKGAFALLPGELTVLDSDADGEAIEIGVVRPDVPDGTQVPVIAFASPYLNPLHVQDLHKTRPRLSDNFVPHGYAVAFVAVRGTANSGGCSDLMGPLERADLDQAITWLGTQDWSNGNVGMIGVSYDGSTPWEVAATGNPHLKTIVPISGVNDVYHLMFHNGTPEFRGPLLLNALYYLYGFQTDNLVEGRSAEHSAKGILCPEAFEGFAASIHAGITGERDPLGYWAERTSRPGVEENYRGSILLIQGLQDWNVDPSHAYPWTNQLEAKGIVVKHFLGQWDHAWPDTARLDDGIRRYDFAEMMLHWFDYWLKEDTTVDLGPRAQVQDSSLAWRNEDTWPPADAVATPFFLTADGELASDASDSAGSFQLLPRPAVLGIAPDCTQCASFASEPFADEFRFAGVPTVHVTVTPNGPAGHIAASLYAVEDNDYKLVGWGQIDLRFAEGGETARPVTPGQPILAKMVLEPLDVVVPAGAKLALTIHQGAYGDHIMSPLTGPATLEVGGDRSVLTVHAFSRGSEVFFEVPE